MPNGLLQEAVADEQAQPTEGMSPEAQALVDQAVQVLYSPGDGNLENMVQMFQQHGVEGFPTAMSTAVLGLLARLQQEGEIPVALLAEVGSKLFEIILEDLIEGGVVTDVTEAQTLEAIALIFEGWASTNGQSLSPEEKQQIAGLISTFRTQAQQSAQQSTEMAPGAEMGAGPGTAGPPGVVPPEGVV
jgi:hypothetical protein